MSHPRRVRHSEIHQVPFLDHSGSPALSISQGWLGKPLLRLFRFAVYITDVTRDSFNRVELFQTLRGHELSSYRLDIFFVSNATADDCKEHCLAEKVARGTYEVQVDAVERGEKPANVGCMPGMVKSYLRTPTYYHHDVLFVGGKDWRADGMLFVEFTPAKVPEEWKACEEDLESFTAEAASRLPMLHERWGCIKAHVDDLSRSRVPELDMVYEDALEMGYLSW